MSVFRSGAPLDAPNEHIDQYHRSLATAAVLLASGRLHPPSARVTLRDGKRVIASVSEATAAITQFWIIQVRSREEAIEWARRAPLLEGDTIELRQLSES